MIRNPVLRGFSPDPSVVRVGDVYYVATSTFEWFPGVKLYRTEDLEQYEQIPSPLLRESQLQYGRKSGFLRCVGTGHLLGRRAVLAGFYRRKDQGNLRVF